MAKSQKKATRNAPQARERSPTDGQQLKVPPPVALTSAAPVLETKKDEEGPAPSNTASRVVTSTALAPILTPRTLMNALTVEAALYILILVASLITRFGALGARPLAQDEAAGAIAAWQFFQGQVNGFVGSPFLFSTNLLLFFLSGSTDVTVRIAPALIGSGVVLLPFLLRRELGRLGALIASALLLISPSLVFFARSSNGAEISTVIGFAAAICLWRYAERGRTGDLYWGAAAAAVAFTAGTAAFTLLLSGVVFALLFRWLVSRETASPGLAESYSNGPIAESAILNSIDRREQWRNAIILFAAVYVTTATAFLMNRAGLGAAFNLLGEWLASFRQLGPATIPLNLLLVYEPLALVFGFAGILLLPSMKGRELRSHGILPFMGSALIVGLIVYSLAGVKSTPNVVVLVVPLAILAGWFMGSQLERGSEDLAKVGGWRAAILGELPLLALALALTALIYLQLASLLQQSRFSPNVESLRQLLSLGSAPGAIETGALVLALVTLVLAVFIIVLAVGSIGTSRAANLGAFFLALLLALWGVRATWLSNFSGSDTVHELIAGEQTLLQARDLVSDLEWESEWRANDPHTLTVRADASLGPVAHWYLRSFKNLKWGQQPQATGEVEALVTTADAPAPSGVWVDQRYRLSMNWQPENLAGMSLLKWLLFRDGGVENWKYVRLWIPKPE